MSKKAAVAPEDVAFIRGEFAPAVERSAPAEELTAIRRALRAKFCPAIYSVQQVDAVCSQVVIQRNRLLSTVAQAIPPAGETALVTDAAIDPETAEPVAEPPADTESAPVIQELPAAATEEAPNGPVTVSSHGDQYRNPTKERWFNEWLGGIVSATTPEWRADANVLTLAGPLCLRLPQYIAAGFRPERITAAEGGGDAEKALFQKNCPPGVRQELRRLEDFVGTETTRYGVVDADFLGFAQDDYLDILADLPLADRAFVLVNVMGRRENTRAKWLLQFANDDMRHHRTLNRTVAMQRMIIESGRIHSDEKMSRVLEKAIVHAEREVGGVEEVELSEARMNALSVLFIRSLGRNRNDLSPYAAALGRMNESVLRRLATDHEKQLSGGNLLSHEIHLNAVGLTQLIHNHMVRHNLSGIPWPKDLAACIGMSVRSMLHIPLVHSLRKIKYRSENHGTPYYTVIAEVGTPAPLLALAPDASAFLAAVNEKSCLATTNRELAAEPPPYTLVNHHLNPLTAGFRNARRGSCPIARGDKLVVTIDGVRAASIGSGAFFSQLDAYEGTIWKRWPLVDEQKQAEIPWEDITVE
jgi:hypothetical protein